MISIDYTSDSDVEKESNFSIWLPSSPSTSAFSIKLTTQTKV